MNRVLRMKATLVAAISLPVLAACAKLEEIPYEPATTGEQWCQERPCEEVGDLIINEPLGSFLVFLLAGLWIASGIYFLLTTREQRARLWFGIALVVGGIGAALAGISFQLFSYELKCAGRDSCILTNGYEVGYSMTQTLSVSALLISIAFACTAKPLRTWLIGYSIVNAVVYAGVLALGVATGNATLLSFEVLIIFAVPGAIALAVIAGIRYGKSRDPMAGSILIAALLLLLVQVAFFMWQSFGLTESLWDSGNGFYFSENDVLHVGMILWLAYAVFGLGRYLADYEPEEIAVDAETD